MDMLHSFGGHALDRFMLDFETAEAVGGEAGAGPSTAQATADVGTGEAAPSTAATETAPAWSPTDPTFLEAVQAAADEIVQGRLGQLMPLLQQIAVTPDTSRPQPQPPEFDPFDPDSVHAYNQARDQQLLDKMQQLLAGVAEPLAARQEAETLAEGEQRIQDILADDIARNGDFPVNADTKTSAAKDLVRPLADALFPEIAQRLGASPRAAEIAVTKAAALVRQVIADAQAAGANAELNRLGTLASARGEPGVGVAGASTVGEIRARGLSDGLSQVTARHARA